MPKDGRRAIWAVVVLLTVAALIVGGDWMYWRDRSAIYCGPATAQQTQRLTGLAMNARAAVVVRRTAWREWYCLYDRAAVTVAMRNGRPMIVTVFDLQTRDIVYLEGVVF